MNPDPQSGPEKAIELAIAVACLGFVIGVILWNLFKAAAFIHYVIKHW